MALGIRICIDRGGTFTDCIAFVPSTITPYTNKASGSPTFRKIVIKLLSEDPQNYPDAPREAIRRVLELATGITHPRTSLVPTVNIEMIRMGTTVATNALLERKGESSLLLITKGFKDLLYIGNQSRPNIFDITVKCPKVLYDHVIEVKERVTPILSPDLQSIIAMRLEPEKYKMGETGEWVEILESLDSNDLKNQIAPYFNSGIRSVAICLMHSYTFNVHEMEAMRVAREIGFPHISVSCLTSPMIKIVPRGNSTCVDSYLTPCIKTYIESFFDGFESSIRDGSVKVEFMQSDGGLVDVRNFNGYKAILSGPAGGVVGYAMTSWDTEAEVNPPVIGFDMGGTSTDVSRFGGKYEHVFESITAGIFIQSPQLDITTVAAGGGSMLFYRNDMFVVGPESAGANPGPTCYRKGGPLTITDANLILGRLIPSYFPKIFGESEKEELDVAASISKMSKLLQIINFAGANSKTLTIDEAAYGFIKVANEAMCRPIRALTEGKGFNAKNHVLSCFGGAGGQHAFSIARSLGISKILIHKHSSILSAYGLALANVTNEVQEPRFTTFNFSAVTYSLNTLADLRLKLEVLSKSCQAKLLEQGFSIDLISTELYLNLRYQGTDNAIMTLKPENSWDFIQEFTTQYFQEFGFMLPLRDVLVDDLRVRCTGKSPATGETNHATKVYRELESLVFIPVETSKKKFQVFWDIVGRIETPFYLLEDLKVGDMVVGPAIIIDNTTTIAVEPECSAKITSEHIVGLVGSQKTHEISRKIVDPVMLSVFGHRFMSIAEQMGRTLQKTSVSTNIKERLDFSCALFGKDGGLVANAPHIPVHLGSMQEAVRWQMRHFEGSGEVLEDGDVLLTNHPSAGGSHLPDITIITPVFIDSSIAFFVASRGHHADIGGSQPGSMPPNSCQLFEEGAAIKSFKIIRDGKFDEIGITRLLVDIPASYKGCTGTRCLQDNISDLKAQIAANHKGITLLKALVVEYTLVVVQLYMEFIRSSAETAVKNLLKSVYLKYGGVLEAVDYMDDGTPISLRIDIDGESGTAIFDFEGTGNEVYGNTNAPTSVTFSAIIYCLRCLIDLDMPLNQGALAPIKIKIPEGCILRPSESAAVVGGNVLTSQRLCDVIFRAFNACAASQGCCNNFTFGTSGSLNDDGTSVSGFGYYETIAGGSGAGSTWDGRSAVQVHMTNTRITDPEILERRYPVILHQFGLRKGSGGAGFHCGGDGVIREIEFLAPIQISMLSERRVIHPYGMNGGSQGKTGKNTLIQKTGTGTYRSINFGGKNAAFVSPGDRFRIETPGGGGWGSVCLDNASAGVKREKNADSKFIGISGGSLGNYLDAQYSA